MEKNLTNSLNLRSLMYSGPSIKLSQPQSLQLIAAGLLISDILGLAVCCALVSFVFLGTLIPFGDGSLLALIGLTVLTLYLADAYHPEEQPDHFKIFENVVYSSLIVIGVVILASAMGQSLYPLFSSNPGITLLGIIIFTGWAVVVRLLIARQIGLDVEQSRWVILADRRNIEDLLSCFSRFYSQADLVFLTDDSLVQRQLQRTSFTAKGNVDELLACTCYPCSGVLVDPHISPSEKLIQELMELRLRGVCIYSLPDFFERFRMKVPPASLQDDWFAFSSGFKLLHSSSYAKVKRLGDVLLAGMLLLLFLPLFAAVALAIKLDSPGPIFYAQTRTGLNQELIKVYKFRSMHQNAEAKGAQWACKHDPRVTRIGRFLRQSRIDELPQLFNVLTGQMSLIGPRPERPEFDQELAVKIPYYNTRYLIRPGITGWAQVLYPYGASVEDAYQKLSYDLYYLKNYSLFLDLRIVLKTIRVVLFRKGL
jgi:exopolysaccharide biosynthesis polyprenyl glycosylphosphotransferase